MSRPQRMSRRLSLYIPPEADELAENIVTARADRIGYEPVLADIWREALMVGLKSMADSEAPAKPKRTAKRK